jgi:hypothetical protein
MDLVLSNDLSVITAEIIAHKGMLSQNVLEIGARLKHVRDNNLAHGQWERWCSEECGISPRNARRYIRIYERFANRTHVADLGGLRKMDMLAEFTDEELETPVQLPSGETKTPIQMNSSEIEQYKRAKAEAERRAKEAELLAKEAEARAAAAEAAVLAERNRANHVEKLWQQAKNQPPKVITQTVEVVPESVKKKIEELEFANTNLRHGYQKAKEKLQEYELKNTVDFDAEEARKQREKLQHEADYNTLELRVHIMNFMEKVAITSYLTGAIAAADPVTKKRLRESVEMLEEFVNQIKAALNGRVLGGVINE